MATNLRYHILSITYLVSKYHGTQCVTCAGRRDTTLSPGGRGAQVKFGRPERWILGDIVY